MEYEIMHKEIKEGWPDQDNLLRSRSLTTQMKHAHEDGWQRSRDLFL